MHDSENEDDVVLLDDVVHHAIIAYAKSVERIADPADGFDGLAADASLACSVTRQFLERVPDPCPDFDRQLVEGSGRRWRQFDAVRRQLKSARLVVRPLA